MVRVSKVLDMNTDPKGTHMAITSIPNPIGNMVIIDDDDRALVMRALACFAVAHDGDRGPDNISGRARNIRDYISDNSEVRFVTRD